MTIMQYLGEETNLRVPARIAGKMVTEIGEKAFAGNQTLKTVQLPASITTIGVSAFENCQSLTRIHIEKTRVIQDAAFAGCTALETVRVNEDNRLQRIGSRAVADCTALKLLATSSAIREIGEDAFNGCDKLVIDILQDNFYTINFCKEHGIRFTRHHETQEGDEP